MSAEAVQPILEEGFEDTATPEARFELPFELPEELKRNAGKLLLSSLLLPVALVTYFLKYRRLSWRERAAGHLYKNRSLMKIGALGASSLVLYHAYSSVDTPIKGSGIDTSIKDSIGTSYLTWAISGGVGVGCLACVKWIGKGTAEKTAVKTAIAAIAAVGTQATVAAKTASLAAKTAAAVKRAAVAVEIAETAAVKTAAAVAVEIAEAINDRTTATAITVFAARNPVFASAFASALQKLEGPERGSSSSAPPAPSSTTTTTTEERKQTKTIPTTGATAETTGTETTTTTVEIVIKMLNQHY